LGLRGPGAKPVRKPTKGASKAAAPKRRKRPAWKRAGLSRGQRVIAFVQSLKLTSGPKAGKPFRLDGWQKRIIREVYDASTEDGRRLARIALLSCGRKNGKTGLVAALVLAHLIGPESESRGQIVSAASDKNQAAIIFREAKAMALADEDLSGRIIVRDFAKEMEDSETGSTYVALSSDVETKHGLFSTSWGRPPIAGYSTCSRPVWGRDLRP
jgi:phage terminase large subunit-like protein